MNINELRKQRAEHWEKMKNFLNTHEQENGTLSIDDTATYKNMEAEFDSMSEAITRAENAAQRESELNRPVASPILDTLSGKPGTTGRGTEDYNKEFLNYIRTRRASNALQEGTSTEGGYLVPTEFEQTLYTARDSVDPIFDLAGRITLGALEKNVPYVSSEGAAALVAEEGTYVVGKDIGEGTYVIKPYPAGSLGIGVLNYEIFINADAKKEYELALNEYNAAYKNAQAEKEAGKTPVWPEEVNESEYIVASGRIDSEEGETGRISLKEGEILVFSHSWETVDITIQKTTGLFMD